MSGLADACALTLSAVSRIVDRLETRGVVRSEEVASDKRGRRVALPDAGLERLRQGWPIHLASVCGRVFDPLDADLPRV